MKKIFTILLVSFFAVIGSAYTIQAVINWKIDAEKAMVKFSINAHGQDLIGNFKGAKGTIRFDEKDLAESYIDCTIDIATVNTGVPPRDQHLQAKSFFDAKSFPTGKFFSTTIARTNEGFNATGDFTLKNTTKKITVPFTYEGNTSNGSFKGSFTIKRSEFKIGEPDDDIGDEVTITLDIPVSKEN